MTGAEAGPLAGAQATSDAPALVEVRDVTRTFGSGRTAAHALRGVSFTVRRGQLTALCGRSGSGKTTLLNIIGGLDVPTGGSVIVAGRDVTGMSERARMELRRDTIAFIFQSFGLIPMLSAAENVGIPLRITGMRPADRDQRVAMMLEIVGLSEHAAHRPDELSGGQQQRIAIARALAGQSCWSPTSRPASLTWRPAGRSCACCSLWCALRASRHWWPRTTRRSWTWPTRCSGWRTGAS